MNNPEQANEPTMEEILASIRRIISDDDQQQAETAGGAEAPAEAPRQSGAGHAMTRAAEPADPAGTGAAMGARAAMPEMDLPEIDLPAKPAEDDPEDEVLELTDEAREPGPEPADGPLALGDEDVADEAGSGAGSGEDGDVVFLEKTEDELDAAFRAEDDLEEAMAAVAQADVPETAGGMSPPDRGRLLSEEPGASVQSAFASLENFVMSTQSRTLEDLVTEMLRPMLREWLDANLPPLVERLVREEIERVSRGRR